ncbi:hypothetical protein [Gallionella capsiferriformans]|uniref:Uncharacterized protein n=1 Tax=Gallionella capsiferriformans (strain ES-2) TaxID=395494 RepID=D9SG16_GALCS|nr:hypothetical protein [Gallionella capsiferriformans]ADL55463.1 hypothetical protein Galf_1443 [Gallionella capsiferriformans ES-2]
MSTRVRFNRAWCTLLVMGTLILSVHAGAEEPAVVGASNVGASSAVVPAQPAAFEIIPEDPLAAKLRISDKTKSYKKTFYLRGYSLSEPAWMDEHRYIAEMHAGDGFEAKFGEIPPKVVIVDTLTGKVEDTGVVGDLMCYSEGRIATSVRNGLSWTMYFGKLGEPLQAYPKNFPQELELNVQSCQLVPVWRRPKAAPEEPQFVARFPLKVEHGTIFEWKPASYPALKIGRDEYGRPGFYRDGPAEMPPFHVYWEQPSGKRIDIQFNPGEKISYVSYLPYEKAYLIWIDLSGTQPIEGTSPRFERLLYLDGTVKRFGVPPVIMDLVQVRKVHGLAKYSKKGFEWGAHWKSRETDSQHIGGFYEVMNGALVKIESRGGGTGPDGCREYGKEQQLFSKRLDFFYIDVCKGE